MQRAGADTSLGSGTGRDMEPCTETLSKMSPEQIHSEVNRLPLLFLIVLNPAVALALPSLVALLSLAIPLRGSGRGPRETVINHDGKLIVRMS